MIKFKKGTIFAHEDDFDDDDYEYEEITKPSTGILAVWGSPNSGKSTVAVKIAKHLAERKKNVVLVTCDTTAPMLPCIIPPNELEVEKSLGSILSATHVTKPLVKFNMVTLKRNSYLTVLGMLKGENEYTYAPYTKVQAEELLDCLREIAPYIIVDCSSYIANDILSAVALMEADSVLRLVNCDLKSISYLSSQLPLLQNSGFDMEKQYKVASNVKPFHGVDQMAGALGSLSFVLPNSQELEEQYLSGNLLNELTLKNSRGFRTEIKNIVKDVFGC